MPGDQQLGLHQRIQSQLQRSSIEIAYALEQLDRELATDCGCGLIDPLSGGEPIEPGHKQVLKRCGHVPLELTGGVGLVLCLDQGPSHLLEKKRDAIAPIHDLLDDALRQQVGVWQANLAFSRTHAC